MIQVEHLAKRFGAIEAVRDVSFTAPDGAVTGLLGPNGAGKSTTLRMLYTVLSPDGGRACVDGIDVARRPFEARRAIGVLAHQAGLYPHLTARENVRYFGELAGMSGAPLERRIDELLVLLDLTDIADRRAKGFSQGQRVKTAIARALVHGPRNVLLDEPTNGLDVMATRALRDVVRRLRDAGHCVLFSSHVMQEVAALCDTIVVVDRGRVIASGAPTELVTASGAASLEEAFVALLGHEVGP